MFLCYIDDFGSYSLGVNTKLSSVDKQRILISDTNR